MDRVMNAQQALWSSGFLLALFLTCSPLRPLQFLEERELGAPFSASSTLAA